MPPYHIDLGHIAQVATQQADDYEAFRYYIEDDERSDAELDDLVNGLAAPIIAGVDCTQCAQCCRILDVYLTPDDAQQLATGLEMTITEVQTRYIDRPRAQAEDEWGLFAARPCTFLSGKLCSIYPHRPQSCRDYPEFTPDFRWQLGHILAGVGQCPIIYHVIEAVKKAIEW